MLEYPSISHKINREEPVYVFDKLDGSCVRAEFTPKNGFYKFGSRTNLIDENHDRLGEAVILMKEKEEQIAEILKKSGIARAVCFFEFWGPNSFAGNHVAEEHEVTLIDVAYHTGVLVNPKEYVELFEEVGIPELLYKGKVNHNLIRDVEKSKLRGMTFEGVVCKGYIHGSKCRKPVRFKIKSEAWLHKLRHHCGDNSKLFEQLR